MPNAFYYFKAPNFPLLLLLLGFCICFFPLSSCQKNKKIPPPSTVASQQGCTILPPLPRSYVPPITPPKKIKNKLLQSTHHLLTALQCTALPEARQYATKYGLGTLLNLPFTTIDSFQIIEHQQQGQWATVYVQVNEDPKAIPLMFRRHRSGRWLFEAIDLQAYLNLSPAQILRHYKFDPTK